MADAYNPMKDLVTVFLPPATGNEEDFIFVGLNGKGWTIRRGEPVRVPRPVADIVDESVRQGQRQRAYEQFLRANAGASARATMGQG